MNNTLKNNAFMFFVACLVSLGGILYGYDIGVISGALLFIKNTIPMTDTEMGMIVGAVLGGGLLGTFIAGPIADRFGRRYLIMAASMIFIVGVALVLAAHTFHLILAARVVLGIGIGVVSVAVPLYVAEVVPALHRGKYMTFFQLFLTFGIVLAYGVDLFFTQTGNWRAMFAVVLVPAMILLVGMIFLPETPRWLLLNKKEKKARAVLAAIYQPNAIDNEVKLIQSSFNQEEGHWSSLFSRKTINVTLVALSIAIFNQLTGINLFLQYAPLLLKQAGLQSDMSSMLGSLSIGLLNFLCTIFAVTLIDSWGRRPLLIFGVTGVMLSELYLGALLHYPLAPGLTGILTLLGLFVFIISFAMGPGVVVWLAISELFPTAVRGKGIALCLFFNSLAGTLLATFFLPLADKIGMANTYWLFALFSGGYLLAANYFLPETKTKSLEQIQLEWQQKSA